MYSRIIVLLVVILMNKTLALDSRCKHSSLEDWHKKVDDIGIAMKTINDMTKVRKIPLCIGTDRGQTLEPSVEMREYAPILDDIKLKENQDSYQVGLSTEENGKSPGGFVKSISFSRITVPEKSMTNLRQWVHVQFSVDSLEGLIVQSICMPLGLPCGEFKIDRHIECPDCLHMKYDFIFLSPCLYRPRASVVHPQAFVFKGINSPKNDLHTNFAWIDVLCQEMLSVQFLIVAVKKFSTKTYEIFYSPVYSNQVQDGKEGSPYLWSKAAFGLGTRCHGGDQACTGCKVNDPIKLGVTKKTGVLLPYNKEYDDCIKNKQGQKNECPPGPFKCYSSRSLTSTSLRSKGIILGDTLEKYREGLITSMMGCPRNGCKDVSEQKEEACKTAIAMNKEQGIATDDSSLQVKYSLPMYVELLTSSVLLHKAENRNHGALMIFAWFVLTTCSIFVSRFLKETGGVSGPGSCLGMGRWLWCHILLSFVTLGLVWMSIASLAFRPRNQPYTCKGLMKYTNSTDKNDTESSELEKLCKSNGLTSVHTAIGYVTLAILYIEVIMGWVRPMTESLRSCNVSVHVFLGYLSIFLALVAVLISKACYEIKVITGGIFLLNMLIIFAVTFLQTFLDGKANKERAQCPVPEAIEISACGILKTILTICQCVLSLILYLLTTVSYSWQQGIQDKYINRTLFSEIYFSSNTTYKCPSFGAGPAVSTILSKYWKS